MSGCWKDGDEVGVKEKKLQVKESREKKAEA
jgi:hypothetical protein